MGLEELTFDVEGVKVKLKPELHKYHENANHDPVIGLVPVTVEYLASMRKGRQTRAGYLCYDSDNKMFTTPLNDLVKLRYQQAYLLEKDAKGMSEVARIYSILLYAKDPKTREPVIRERNFYRNSQGEWKDIGDWLGVYREDELREMADAVK